MTTIWLGGTGHGAARVPGGPFRVTATAAAGAAVRILDAAPDRPDDPLRDPARLRLAHVARPTLLRVEPAAGTTFPGGATVTVWLRPEPFGAADEVVIGPVPVAGLAGLDVVRLEPDGPDVRVSTPEVVADDDLGVLADAARARTRVAIGADRIDPDRAGEIRVAVDGSASMRRAVEDGSVHAVLEVLVGMAAVVGRAGGPTAELLTGPPEWSVPAGEPAVLAERVLAGFGECGFGIGFRPPRRSAGGHGYLLTDAVPPRPVGPGWRLVLLGSDIPGVGLPAPPGERSAGEHLLAVPAALAALVDSLLPPLSAPADPEGPS